MPIVTEGNRCPVCENAPITKDRQGIWITRCYVPDCTFINEGVGNSHDASVQAWNKEIKANSDPEIEVKHSMIPSALAGDRGEDQKRIAEVGLAWVEQLLKKNQDYGSTVWNTPVLAPECDAGVAIRVRMSDKISRIHNLMSKEGTPEINESIEDSIADLGAYCLLLLASPKR